MIPSTPDNGGFQLIRMEWKYTIPAEMVEPVSDYAGIYCALDKYAAAAQGGFYRINNLYFDTPDYLFLRRRLANCENRFNLRIRSYSDTEELPCFFEIKQRKDAAIRKIRARIREADWHRLFTCPGYAPEYLNGLPESAENKPDEFLRLSLAYNATPKILTQYRRRAFVSSVDDYGRVTIDVQLRCQSREDYNLLPDEREMVPYDDITRFDPGCCAVLELKCYTSHVPLWMSDLVRLFDLQRRSFSKYVTGITQVLDRYHYDPAIRQSKEAFV